ncbi:long-chain-fatty-acid--CoA ligase [Aggregicoccus sp. 17bor-14]|uniref:long-chain-fatty-acid--CoA ligase n=1 Tax=Myxococcaceae TaxID=31 RepID=UPI00129C4774|nr:MULTISPECIES: long-chain-fatty-acid--CoA ligase [Myxococcaceae]MBF5044601.1 long-chain-fatty-acid--CoA ligase [Simulacricoccus sp. 17bor-14]MRI90345.1 long-chain-fatty-acid--CoA ligase [Aggregicoccus sp. 17bor-14]
MLGQMMNEPLLISGQIEFAARFHAATEVVTRTVEGPIARSTWGEVARRVRRLAHALEQLGVKPGDRIATLGWNTQRHLELYFAVSGIGAVLHTLNPRLPPEQLRYIVDHAGDTVLCFDTTFLKLAQFLAQQGTALRHFVALTDAAHLPQGVGLPELRDYEGLLAGHPDTFRWPLLDEGTASSLCYTSGTAGNPKGVLYSHRSTVLHSYAISMADTLAISAQDVTLPVVPMFHVNAWGVPYAAAMTGSKLVLPGPGLDGASLLELIDSEGVTSLLGVPTVWLALLQHLRSVGRKLSGVEKVTIDGSACPPSMIEAFEREHGARVIHAWGMTEMSPVGTANVLLPKHRALAPEAQLALKAKQGRPVFGVDLRLVDDAGNVLPHDGRTPGHLQVHGPWVASAYFRRDPDEAHQDGWFFTGDIATVDPDGYMQITDRSKDVIKSGGEWVSSIELENAAMSHPAVAQAAAIGVPHPKWQERPLLVVVRAPGKELTREELLRHLETRLVKWWMPDAVEFVDALPLGGTGKVLKRELRQRFASYALE